jgi:hypothetical protein
VGAVDVIILHPLPGLTAGPLETALADVRRDLAERNRSAFLAAGAETARVVAGPPDARPYGVRLRELRAGLRPGRGLVILGSGALPLATRADLAAFVAAAAAAEPLALANNRYSADVVAVSSLANGVLARLPDAFPTDNALPRWLAEVGGVRVIDLRRRWRLAMDLDSPLDAILVATARPGHLDRLPGDLARAAGRLAPILDAVRATLTDRHAELVVAGRTSGATLSWLERGARCRVRAMIEERGLRASSSLALEDPASASARRPRSILGMVLDAGSAAGLGDRLAELGDAALVDTRVLLAHRLGGDEAAWPSAEARFGSDLLDPARVDDPWLAELTAAAAAASIPILLGGHSLVGPGIRLIGSRS